MQTNNQKIIFEVPESTTPAKIILEIMKKNGITDVPYEILKSGERSKIAIISDITKEFFIHQSDKKALDSLSSELKITNEKSGVLLKDIKNKLVPYAEKVIIQENVLSVNKQGVPTIDYQKNRLAEKSTEENKKTIPKTRKEITFQKPITERPSKIPKKIIKQEVSKPSGPDSYREPIE